MFVGLHYDRLNSTLQWHMFILKRDNVAVSWVSPYVYERDIAIQLQRAVGKYECVLVCLKHGKA